MKRNESVPRDSIITIKFDEPSQEYYIVWQPIVIGSGGTKEHALEDLRDAAHFGVDTVIGLKLGGLLYDGNQRQGVFYGRLSNRIGGRNRSWNCYRY